jgi:hypothetical protein
MVLLLNGIISVPNFTKIYQAVQNLLAGNTQTDSQHRQTGDLISLLSFLESRLKNTVWSLNVAIFYHFKVNIGYTYLDIKLSFPSVPS